MRIQNKIAIQQLSDAIKKYPQCVDEFKIRLVQKQIKEIDKVPTFYKKIDTLYLSNNSIKTLDGIEQFTMLQHLSISNNNIKDIGMIKLIRKLDALESLNMSGNPVSKHPIYRQIVLTALPNLQLLDGKPVTKEDKNIAEVQLKKQNSYLDLILNNYIEIKKLYYISQKLNLHSQLGQVHFQFINYHPQFQNLPINLQQIKKLYDFQSHFPQFVKEEMIDNIMSDILTIYSQMNEKFGEQESNYEKSFTELLMKQQQLLAQLNVQCDQKVENLNKLKQKIKQKYKEQPFTSSQYSQFNSTQRTYQQEEQGIYSPKITKEEIRSQSPKQEQEYNQNTLYFKSLQQSKRVNTEESKQKQNSTKRSQSPNRNIPIPQSQEGLPNSNRKILQSSLKSKQQTQEVGLNSTKKSIDNVTFQQSQSINNRNYHKHVHSPNHECCRRLMNQDEHSLEEFKRSQNSRSPYRQTNNDLKNLVSDLSQVVSQKEGELQELQQINQRIIDDQFEKQKENYELLDLAQRQIQNLHEREKGEQEIESEIQELRQQINQLMHKNVDLEREAQEKTELEKQIVFKEGQIQELNYRNTIEEKAENFNERRLKLYLLNNLYFAVQLEKKINQFREYKLQQQADYLQGEYFKAWLRRVLIKKFQKVQIYEHQCILQKKMITTWRQNIQFKQKLSLMKERRERIQLKKSMICWKQNQRITQIKQQKKEKIKKYYQRKVYLKAFKSLRSNMLANRINPIKERRLTDLASNFYNKRMRSRMFEAWQTYQYEIVIPNRKRIEHMQKLFQFQQMQRIFKVLQQIRIQGRQNLLAARQYASFQTKRFKNLIFKCWKQMYLNQRTQKVEIQALKRYNKLKSMFNQWKQFYVDRKHGKKMTLKYLSYVRQSLQKKYFKAIVQYRKRIIDERRNTQQIQKMASFNFYKLCFKEWNQRMIPIQAAKEYQIKIRQGILQKCFIGIKKYARRSLKNQFNQINLDNYLVEKEKKELSTKFTAFRKYVQGQVRLRKIVDNFKMNQKYRIYRVFINSLCRENILKQKTIIYQMNHQLKLNETNINSSSDVIHQYELEKQELINEINYLKEENFGQKLSLEEYQQAQIKYNSSLRSIERQEKIFREEKDSYEVRIRDYEELLKQIHEEYQKQIHQKDVQIHDSQNENRAVQKQFSILQKEIEQIALFIKQNTILDTEKALLNRGEQSTIILRETEKKLQNSIVMANEFKNKIEEQDYEIEELKNQMYRRDLDIDQLKIKLKESLDLVRETSDMYDLKINDFNAIIESKNSQIQEFIDKQIRFQDQINELQQELRKQHLEIEMFQEMQPMLEHPEVNQYYQEYQDLQNDLDAQRINLKKRMDKLNRSLNQIQDVDRRAKQQTYGEHNNIQQERTTPLYSRDVSPLSERIYKEQENIANILKQSGVSTIKSYFHQNENQPNFKSIDTFSNFHNQSNNIYNIPQVEDYSSVPMQRLNTDPSAQRFSHQKVERNAYTRASYEPYNHFGEEDFAGLEGLESTEQLAEELERNRANRMLFKQNIERRISRLETNIDKDLAQNERNRSRSRSQSPDTYFAQA